MSDEQSVTEESIDPLKLFSPNVQRVVEGLVYLGQLTDSFSFCGHTFIIRTLKPYHKMAISQVIQPYRNTLHEVDVFQFAHVGLALTEVDGRSDFCPQAGPDMEGFTRARLTYVTNEQTGWYEPTLNYLWLRYAALEAKSTQAIAELDRLSQGSQPTNLPPWLDSLTALGHSVDPTSLVTQPSTPSNSDS